MAFEEENNQTVNSGLAKLSNSDFEIKDGQQDITGWDVLSRSGEKIGEVADLLFDPQAQKVRYLVIRLQASGEEMDDNNKLVLVPVGVAELRADNHEVALPIGSAQEITGLPAYLEGGPSPEDEVQIRSVFGGTTAPYEHPQFYHHEHFHDGHFNRENLPDNSTIIPAEDMDRVDRAERAGQIVERLHQSDEEPRSTEFPEGRIVGEYEAAGPQSETTESLERENNQPVEETGNNDYQLNEGTVPEPESVEQEEAWQDDAEQDTRSSKLMEFFINELKDLLWAEKELVETLPELADAATSAELKNAFRMHLSETETHVNRLEQVFAILGLEPESRKCDAMAGIIDEGDEIIDATEEGTAQRDVGLIFAGQKAEHYEIASYGGMIALAKTLGYDEVAELFVMTLDEEKTADAKLTEIAENQANYDAGRERTYD